MSDQLPPLWHDLLADETSKPYWSTLQDFVAAERQVANVYPPLGATFRAFAFDRQWVTQDELGRPEAGDFPSDLGEAFLGLRRDGRGEREGEAETIGMAQPDAFGAIVDAEVDRGHAARWAGPALISTRTAPGRGLTPSLPPSP